MPKIRYVERTQPRQRKPTIDAVIEVTDMPDLEVFKIPVKMQCEISDLRLKILDLYRMNIREIVRITDDKDGMAVYVDNWFYVSRKTFDEIASKKQTASGYLNRANICAYHTIGLSRQFELPLLITEKSLEDDFGHAMKLSDVKFKFCPMCGQDVSGVFEKAAAQS